MIVSAILLFAAPPAWLDRTVAGYALAGDAKHEMVGVHDARRGFYLVRTNECDGSIVTLTLTRDRNVVAEMGYAVPDFMPRTGDRGTLRLVEKPLPSLATGRGVRIGDAPGAVRLRLGPPTKTTRHASFQDFVYETTLNDADKTRRTQRYTFKSGRLVEIQFDLDSSPE